MKYKFYLCVCGECDACLHALYVCISRRMAVRGQHLETIGSLFTSVGF